MNKKIVLFYLFALLSAGQFIHAQDNDYLQAIKAYQKKYVKEHEVVKGHDKEHMLFFPVSEEYKVNTKAERIYDAPWFNIPTSANRFKEYRVYAILRFTLHDTVLVLHVYQSKSLMQIKEYEDDLFIPFTDKTCGEQSYDNGRYLDLKIQDIEPGSYTIDFNKAYNPYCAYVSGRYNCPIPPKENDLPVAIRAGEMKFSHAH